MDKPAHSRSSQIGASASGRRRQPSEIAQNVAVYDADFPAMSTSAVQDLLASVVDRVASALSRLERRYSAQGRSLAELGPAEELADRMVAALPSPSPWNELGPFYSSAKVAKLLGGISRQAVADRRARGTLLGLKTADGAWVYPDFQFDEHHAVLPGLAEIVKVLASSGVDEWTLASWLTSPMRSLDDLSPIEWLRRGEDQATLRAVAEDAARRFAQ